MDGRAQALYQVLDLNLRSITTTMIMENKKIAGRPRKPCLAIEWCHDIPNGVVQMAKRRTKDMLTHYGRNITAMPIETLVASCYLQGIEDCFTYHEKATKKQHSESLAKDCNNLNDSLWP